MTESELLASDEFHKWCGVWQSERWCPSTMADWLLERGFERGFRAAMWAVEKEERRAFPSWDDRSRTFPAIETGPNRHKGRFYWMGVYGESAADGIPIRRASSDHYRSFPAAIAFYLVNFDDELAAKYPPKREAVTA